MEMDLTYMQYTVAVDTEALNKKKIEEFKERISRFADVDTVEAAKALAKEILPTANEMNILTVGNAKCYVVDRPDVYRITLDSPSECICYDFISPEADIDPEEIEEVEEV